MGSCRQENAGDGKAIQNDAAEEQLSLSSNDDEEEDKEEVPMENVGYARSQPISRRSSSFGPPSEDVAGMPERVAHSKHPEPMRAYKALQSIWTNQIN